MSADMPPAVVIALDQYRAARDEAEYLQDNCGCDDLVAAAWARVDEANASCEALWEAADAAILAARLAEDEYWVAREVAAVVEQEHTDGE